MRSYALILATGWLATVPSTASDQIIEPRADRADFETRVQNQETQEQYDYFKDNMRTLYFAANCGVLSGLASGEWGATVAAKEDILCQWGPFASDRIMQAIEQAKDEGRSLKRQRGCSYWKERFAKSIKLKEYVEMRVLNAADTSAGTQPVAFRCERGR